MEHNITCPCCGHDLYHFSGHYDAYQARALWDDWKIEMKPHHIQVNTYSRDTWLYLFAPDPGAPAFPASHWRGKSKAELREIYAFQLGDEAEGMTKEEIINDLMTITADHYWQSLLAYEGSGFVSANVPHYIEIRGHSQGDYAMIAFTDAKWYQKEFSWMTKEHLTHLFYDQPWTACITGPGDWWFYFDEHLDTYDYWDKDKALETLARHHPWLVTWAQEHIPKELQYV